jgi:drug/metabolite transporter (DMT)-like permease
MFWPILLCSFAGVIGAFSSLKSTQGASVFWPFATGLIAIAVWAWMTKQPMKPWVAAVLFDGVYGLTWLLTLLALGEQPGWRQGVGGVLVLAGLLFAGWEA